MNIGLLVAGMLSLAVCLIHLFLGGKEIARPLLDTTALKPIPKYTNYYCWHLVSLTIAGMGVMFLVAAWWPSAVELAWAGMIMSALFSLWNIGLYFGVRRQLRAWHDMPQWLLFAPIAVVAYIGIMNA